MKNLIGNFLDQFKKGGLFYRAAIISMFTTLLIMVFALIKFFISPKIGDWIDILMRFAIGFCGSFLSLFVFFSIYLYFNPTFDKKSDD